MTVFFTSDTHFGDPWVLRIDKRPFKTVPEHDTALVLCHYAFRTWKNMGRGWIDLHGHSHGKLKKQKREYDVGVDAWDYQPVTLETVLGARRRMPARGA